MTGVAVSREWSNYLKTPRVNSVKSDTDPWRHPLRDPETAAVLQHSVEDDKTAADAMAYALRATLSQK